MPSKVLFKAGQEVLFRMHEFQHERSPKERNVIRLPNSYRLGTALNVLNRIADKVISELLNGKSTVVINIGNKIVREARDLASGRKTFGTHAYEYFTRKYTLCGISEVVGKEVKAYEGIKPYGTNTINFYEVESEYSVGKDDSCYIALKVEGGEIRR